MKGPLATTVAKQIRKIREKFFPTTTRYEQLMQRPFDLSDEERADIAAADAEQRRLVACINQYGGDRAKNELSDARGAYEVAPTAENLRALERHQLAFPHSKVAYQSLRTAARTAARAHGTRVLLPIARSLFARALHDVDARLSDLRAEAELLLDAHGVAYEPSPLEIAVRAFRGQLETAHLTHESQPTATLAQTLSILVHL
jgi:hypothetical protein